MSSSSYKQQSQPQDDDEYQDIMSHINFMAPYSNANDTQQLNQLDLQQQPQQQQIPQLQLDIQQVTQFEENYNNGDNNVFNQYHQFSNNDFLSPLTTSQFQNNNNNLYRTPSHQSIYSENSFTSQPNSPYLEAPQQFSSAYSDLGSQNNSTTDLFQHFDLPNNNNQFQSQSGYLDSSNSNNQFNFSNPQVNFEFDITVTPPPNDIKSPTNNLFEQNSNNNLLTENNLSNYNNQQRHSIVKDESGILISVQQAPDLVAAKTPSLFSNSSANSSVKNELNNNLSPNDDNDRDYLSPGKSRSRSRTNSISKSPRSRSRSRSKSRSSSTARSISNEDLQPSDTLTISSREKMLELASPNQSSKRTQKHPSVYACHLCDKRFTRPYNLKSHLRTHTDERPFICLQCGKAFARQHDRKRHEDLHSGEKKFQCKGFLKNGQEYGCGRKFARADALRRHFQTDAGKECIRSLMEEEEEEKRLQNPVIAISPAE